MSKRLRVILITALAAIAALCVFSGCQLKNTLDDILETKHLKAQVTYFANGGSFSDDDRTQVKTLYYNIGTFPLDISEQTSSVMTGTMGNTQVTAGRFTIDYTGYNLKGWYLVEVNEDGIPVYEDGSLYDAAEDVVKQFKLAAETVDSESKYQFADRLQDGEHIYLCAVWEADSKLIVKLAGEQGLTVTANDTTYNLGDVLREEHFPADGKITVSTSLPKDGNTTYVAYYTDPECTQLFEATTVTQSEADTVLYAKYIKNHENGREWSIVKTASDVKNLFDNTANGTKYNYYFIKDIDCTGVSATLEVRTTDLIICGNNFKVLNFTKTHNNLNNGKVISLFGKISENSEISNLTFENLTLNCTFRNDAGVTVYFVFESVANGAEISDVTVNGTVNITANGGRVLNALNDLSNVSFGGFTADSEYTAISSTVEYNIN